MRHSSAATSETLNNALDLVIGMMIQVEIKYGPRKSGMKIDKIAVASFTGL
jgi:hypothetical protein